MRAVVLVLILMGLFQASGVAKDSHQAMLIDHDHAAQRWAQNTLKSLSLDEKIGQMLQVRYFGESSEDADYVQLRTVLQKYHIGSVILGLHMHGPNLLKPSALSVARVTNQIQKDADLPVLVAADLERGLASRLDGVPSFPFAMAFGADGSPADAYTLGLMTAREARAIGVHWAFAPVADVNTNAANPIIDTRSFGDDPGAVGNLVAAFIRGAHAGQLLVTAKHFPGQGSADVDSHKRIPTLNISLQHLQQVEFPPFESAINAGVDAVLVEHAKVPALDQDADHVATTSPVIINDILKGQLGFRGLVVTDALEMRGLMEVYASRGQNPTARAVVDAVKAGNDVIAIPAEIDVAFNALTDAVRNGEISESRIDASVLKILEAKASLGLNTDRLVNLEAVNDYVNDPSDLQFAQLSADRAVTLVKSGNQVLPLTEADQNAADPGRTIFVVFKNNVFSDAGQSFQSALHSRLRGVQIFVVDPRVANEIRPKLMEAVAHAHKVIITAFTSPTATRKEVIDGNTVTSFGLIGPSRTLMTDLLSEAPDKIAVISAGNPYLIENFPKIQTYMCTYSTSPTSDLAALKAIFGELEPIGKLPINLPGVASRGTSLSWSPVQYATR